MLSSEQLKLNAQQMLGSRLKMRRMEMSLTQEELGVYVGYSPMAAKQAISQIERGVTWIPNKKQSEFILHLQLDRELVTLLSYHFFSRNYSEVLQMLRERNEAELRHRTQRLRINMTRPEVKPGARKTAPASVGDGDSLKKEGQSNQKDIPFRESFDQVESHDIHISQTKNVGPDPLTIFKTRLTGLLDAAEFMEKDQLIQALKKIINE